MFVVDTSALIAILNRESDAAEYATAIAGSSAPLLSAASMVETGIVMLRPHGPSGLRKVYAVIQESGIPVTNVTPAQATLALEAYAEFGKGSASGSDLNFGDCFAHALAKSTGLPLLFKGNDFSRTGIDAAHPGAPRI